jgi:ubiquinone/menaquinone biosynthesis C-methylase UbiE
METEKITLLEYGDFEMRMDIRLKKAIAMFPCVNKNDKKVLDLGCGDGLFSEELIKKGYECYGIDACEEPLKKAKERGVKTIRYNIAEGIPFEDKFFDCIFAGEIIEHFLNTDFILGEMKRVLKDNGFAVITLPNIKDIYVLFSMIFRDKLPYVSHPNDPHIRNFTYSIAKETLKQNGFKIIEFRPVVIDIPYFWIPGKKFLSHRSQFLAKIFPKFSTHFVFKVVKKGAKI